MGNTYKYTIPELPPSNNQYIGKNKRWQYQADKKRWANLINLFCTKKPKKPIEHSKVTLFYHFKDNIRRDPDNYSGKFILDGLVRKGILKDDSFKCVELVLKSDCDKTRPRTEIFIEEIVKNA